MKSTGNSTVFKDARARFLRHLREARPDSSLEAAAAGALASGAPLRARVRLGARPETAGCLFKFYTGHRHFNRWRPSRARLAWAAGRTLAELGIPAVEVVGFVERAPALAPFESCLVMRAIPDAITLREWVRRHHRRLSAADWALMRARVCESWLRLGAAGVYHDDTKALNLLTTADADPLPERLIWLDLESVHPGRRPGRRHVLRNLVQLNGSLRKWVPDAERHRFLDQAARAHPWLRARWVECAIRHWTRKRLLNEVRTRCGP